MKKIIRKILREEFEYKQQLFNLLRSGDEDNIEMVRMISQGQGIDVIELLIEFFKEDNPPYFKILNHFDLSEDELDYVLSGIFGGPVRYTFGTLYDDNGNEIYYEEPNGQWEKIEYDKNGNEIYWKDSDGYWSKKEYDKNGNLLYYENSSGFWYKREYDENNNMIYQENSDGVIRDYR
jgi:YD repeat-containing protein